MSNQYVVVGAFVALCCAALAPAAASAELTSVSQFLEYAKGRDNEPAVAELVKVVANEPQQDPCSQQKADQVRDYHATYVADKSSRPAAEVLDFFLAYGLKLSQLCRRQAITLLAEHAVTVRNTDDSFSLKSLDEYTNSDGVIAKIFTEPRDYQDLVLPENLARLIRIGSRTKSQLVFLKTYVALHLVRLKRFCKRRIEPGYKELILPLVTLSKAGFNFDDKHGPERTERLNKKIYQWYRITFLCEALDSFELIELVGGDKRALEIISSEEAEELRKTSPELFGSDDEGNAPDLEPYDVSRRTARLADQIVEPTDVQLHQAIKKYKTEPNLLVRVIKKLGNSIRNLVEKGLIKVVFGRNTLIGGRHVSTGRDLLKLVDEDLAEAQLERHRSDAKRRHKTQEEINFEVNLITGAGFLVAIGVITGIILSVLHWGAHLIG